MKRPKTTVHKLNGGPFDGLKFRAESASTLEFRLKGFVGSYDIKGKWKDKNEQL